MMKKKLFYLLAVCFFSILGGEKPLMALDLSKEQLLEIEKIEAHNQAQLKNRKFLKDYQLAHSDKIEVKDDGYWEMAFHAKLADYGDKESQYIIAKAYENGQYTAQNPKKAVAFYKKAAEQGHIESAMRLGQIYQENKWLAPDDEKALYYYLKAAKEGYVPAQMKIAFMYEENEEYQEAYDWFFKAMSHLFPNEKALEERSPDLKRLSQKLALLKEKTQSKEPLMGEEGQSKAPLMGEEGQSKTPLMAVENASPTLQIVADETYQNGKARVVIYEEVLPKNLFPNTTKTAHQMPKSEVPYEG